MSVDLDLFCNPQEREPGRDLSVPFSLNGYTYATDGAICVRVPRRPDIPENKDAPNAEARLSWDFSRVKFGPLPKLKTLPDKCGWCLGRGYQHNCPDCRCECEHCNGFGKFAPKVQIGKTHFSAQYVAWIEALPELEIGKPRPAPHPLPFRFKGGEGLLMPLGNGSSARA
jgi:hypothetical protein